MFGVEALQAKGGKSWNPEHSVLVHGEKELALKLELELEMALGLELDLELGLLGDEEEAMPQSQQTVTTSKVTRRKVSPSCLR